MLTKFGLRIDAQPSYLSQSNNRICFVRKQNKHLAEGFFYDRCYP